MISLYQGLLYTEVAVGSAFKHFQSYQSIVFKGIIFVFI